jgi:streptogramin lyase
MSETTTKLHIGKGILKPGTRPIKVYVDEDGEYWICDADVDPKSEDFRKEGCAAHSDIHLVK